MQVAKKKKGNKVPLAFRVPTRIQPPQQTLRTQTAMIFRNDNGVKTESELFPEKAVCFWMGCLFFKEITIVIT